MVLNFLLVLLLSVICQFDGLATTTIMARQARNSQLVDDETSQAIKGLASRDDETREQSQKRLLEIAKSSTASRGRVIRDLIGLLEAPGTRFNTWSAATEILGELKSTEALDSLVKHLDKNDGTAGLSSSHFPALRAVINIGQPAVPKLATALFKSKPSIRRLAAQGLGTIGGKQAKDTLERALKTEKDEQVVWAIRTALSGK